VNTHVTVYYSDRDQPVKFRAKGNVEAVQEKLYSKVALIESTDGGVHVIYFEKVDHLQLNIAY
jgi:hypothetical protein